MEIIKSLRDYCKTPEDNVFCDFLEKKLVNTLCCEKIKNKDMLLEYVKPVHNFIIYTNYLPYGEARSLS